MTSRTERIPLADGGHLTVRRHTAPEQTQLELRLTGRRPTCLHWGLAPAPRAPWQLPPRSTWPPDSVPAGGGAVRTPFTAVDDDQQVSIRLPSPPPAAALEFVLFFPEDNRWDNNHGRNYRIDLRVEGGSAASPASVLRAQLAGRQMVFERSFELDDGVALAAAVCQLAGGSELHLLTNLPGPLLLHWGVARRTPYEWLSPPPAAFSPETRPAGRHAAQTPFASAASGSRLTLRFAEPDVPLGVPFVLFQPEAARWLKHRGGNFYVPIKVLAQKAAALPAPDVAALADEIIRAEMGPHGWTLMHRFNLCHDLLERARGNLEALALLFVWLRYSALRQLTWQRNYNTKPRELSHAQDRLTARLAEWYRREPDARPLLRLMLGAVGRGGEGQRIRDEILQIMHRHHIKEVAGHFLEEWHQKLHNNTTPDDVVICEAYLEFLRTDGNLDRFYETLREGGVTKQRLESFERPIRTPPDFVPPLKEALLRDFQDYLRTLKSVHAGADLETAAQAATPWLDDGLHRLLDELWRRRDEADLRWLAGRITEARRRLQPRLTDAHGARELIYLDLALEQTLRRVIERHVHLPWDDRTLADLITLALENLVLSHEDPELARCWRHWEKLSAVLARDRSTDAPFAPLAALHAKAVLDRTGRGLSALVDRFYQWLQPKAEYLGQAFHAEPWAITLFSEEVVRGSSVAFALSVLLHRLEPRLRQAAQLGPWQIVSRGRGAGRVEVVEALRSIQGRTFEQPTIVLANQVHGDEEIPEGVTAVIAPNVTDLVSHVAVRARNAGLLFASCYDADTLARLRALQGHWLALHVTPGGDVSVEEIAEPKAVGAAGESPSAILGTPPSPPAAPSARPRRSPSRPARWAITAEEFDPDLVGGKARHLATLRQRLPAEIGVPASVAIPFGVFEHVLALDLNREAARRYEQLLERILAAPPPATQVGSVTAELRATVEQLAAPEPLREAVWAALRSTNLPAPARWEDAWTCIKRVWASVWNERAFLSRVARGLPHEALRMAVLIQEVVPARYAFVVHTVNPFTGNRDELYAEVVLGLGETLVGNFPGRALGFWCDKHGLRPRLLSFPAKSVGLYGRGLIFRSDSSGEDLPGFAGAGLYDSVLLPPARVELLDYRDEPLVWDEPFRDELLTTIARAGLAVEQVFGSPQDVEGAWTDGRCVVVQARPQVGLTAS